MLLGTVTNHTTKLQEVHYQSSTDLLTWSEARLLTVLPNRPGSRDGMVGMYPTMLDPSDTSRNFERFGSGGACEGHIYWQRFDCASPSGTCLARNWLRYPLKVVISAHQ